MAVVEQQEQSAAADGVRAEVRAFLDKEWDPDLTLGEWWRRLADGGWAVPTWPAEWFGRGLPGDVAAVVGQELAAAGAPGAPAGLGLMLAAPTILTHGTDEQKRRYLAPIVYGEEGWCQLFSEPGAGSDLASLQCRAVQDGDEWVITGQKVWTSNAHLSELGMLLARTNPDAPKHRGITYFLIEMDQPGIEVRPLREMTGRALFNEVFFDEARVSSAAVLGGPGGLNEGWGAALTTLANERVGLGGGGGHTSVLGGRKAGTLGRRAGDVGRGGRGGTPMAGLLAGRNFGLLQRLAREHGVAGDPIIRQELARLYTLTEISRFTHLRAKGASAQGRRPGPEVSTGKLQISKITRASREVGLQILGARGMLAGRDAPEGGVVQELALFSPAVSVYGGSDEIQRNIIGERVLGLPKEPSSDKDVPFRDLRVGTQRNPT